ncbi:TIGR04063 family PEP-CTERM/XrtA system glycosyltransferase [Sphingopyxis sp.]|jgi:PEP-CTERM/exosortase A-associated glycosyltransferase|uniref:TIGR04063 family PEP-CTERM/XrtA system glycosyltransferase n=1 Tax=Sphingopyxis sp. TaxID=1908224 RepID=UPI0025D49F24|nr:TIGR04063 family PEP-CTERM/XrtA system glycosyltransferase [Sphingopyxis sp.]MBK6411823.1 glycosyltransferase, exosortase A system-associated [Sphingopyxis sp.]
MTRILHVLDHSLPTHSGYTFRTRALMKAQASKGWDVAGVTGLRHPEPGPDGETVDGLTFYRTPPIAPARAPIREWREIGALAKRVEALARQWKPDVLHAHSPVLDGLAALRVGKRLGIPVIYEIRAFWEDASVGNGTGREGSLRYWLTRQLETHAAKSADAVAVICEGLRGDLIARGIDADKITVSPNGVDLELFGDPPPRDNSLADTLGIAADDAVIGYIGSFYDYEGIDDLIAAMPALVAVQPRARLLLVGGGPMEAALKAQAAVSCAAAQIHFVGRVPHHEVERYYSLIDILAYPRKKMRLTDLVTPLKPLEAMAQGKLVAASDVGGHRELIEDGVTGTLFAPDEPKSIADALAKLLENRGIWAQRRRTARIFVETHRNWSSNILRYEPVYQRLLRGAA